MAIILYTYSVTSIRAAKRNAKLHREADGGQLDMRRESLRRHGVLEQVRGTGGVELFRDASREQEDTVAQRESGKMGQKKAKSFGGLGIGEAVKESEETETRVRTGVERRLEEYKGRGRAVEKFKAERSELVASEE